MGNPKIAIVAYCLAIAFILAVALHSPSKTLITAGEPAVTPVADLKWNETHHAIRRLVKRGLKAGNGLGKLVLCIDVNTPTPAVEGMLRPSPPSLPLLGDW
jgi:hypothetical protein